jgi:hypothetical protein
MALWNRRETPIFLVAFFLAVHVYAVVANVNSWPVSGYPMFSRNRKPEDIGVLRLEAVLKNGKSLRLPIYTDTTMARILMHWTTKDPGVFAAVKDFLRADFGAGSSQPDDVENVHRVKYQMVQNLKRDLSSFVDWNEVRQLKVSEVGAVLKPDGKFEEKIDEQVVIDISPSPL